MAGELVKTFFNTDTHKVKVYIPEPTWGNHVSVFAKSGLEPVKYRYYDNKRRMVDYEGLTEDIRNAADGSFFLLHPCAHNPTGCDPTRAQWDELSQLIMEKKHLVFFDCAYQV